jgi:hypothetical protein
MRGILIRKGSGLAELYARPDAWLRLHRHDALRLCADHDVVVVTPVMGLEKVEWLHGNNASMKGDAPYRLDHFRFYQWLPRYVPASPKGISRAKPALPDPPFETDGEPLLEKEPVPILANPRFWEKESNEGTPMQLAAAN